MSITDELEQAAMDFVKAERAMHAAKNRILSLYNNIPQYGGILKIDWGRIRDIGQHGGVHTHWKAQIEREIMQANKE